MSFDLDLYAQPIDLRRAAPGVLQAVAQAHRGSGDLAASRARRSAMVFQIERNAHRPKSSVKKVQPQTSRTPGDFVRRHPIERA